MAGLYDMLASVLGSRAPGENPYGFLAGALKADPEGAGGFADIAGRSREAGAAAGAITAPLGALDYFGKTLRGEEPFYDVAGHPLDRAYSAAGTLAGLGMTGGIGAPVRTAAGEVALGAGPIRAYHGSPHDFERFDLSKIGTGEGAQAYGHGLYFAENEGVARAYRDALTKNISNILVDGVPLEQAGLSKPAQQLAQMHVEGFAPLDTSVTRAQQSLAKANAELAASPGSQVAALNKESAERTLAAAQEVLGRKFSMADKPPGRMYEVGIHADPQRFLDWDRPLARQPKPVQRSLTDLGIPAGDSGQQIYTAIATRNAPVNPISGEAMPSIGKDPAGASEALRQAGIPGIQYLDQGSRGAGTGSLNRVVFDDKLVEILRKYGFLGPLIAGAATASMPEAARK